MNTKAALSSLSIRNIIIIVCMVLMLATVGVISYIVFSNWLSSADEITTKIAEDMNGEIFHQIDIFMHATENTNEANQKLIVNDIVDLTDESKREKFFVGVLNSHDSEIYSFSYGTESGEYYGARRNENGVIEIMRNNANTGGNSWYYSVRQDLTAGQLVVQAGKYDPRTRNWYQAAKAAGKPVFSPIYKHFVMDDLTVSAAWPIFDNSGNLKGVLGTHMILTNIDDYLEEIVADKNGVAVIVEKNSGELVANSFDMDNFTIQADTLKRFQLSEIENQTIAEAYKQYQSSQEDHFAFRNGSNSLNFKFTEYHKDGLDWVIITAIPQSLLMAGIVDNIRFTLILVVLAILLSLLIYFMVTKKLIAPIDSLAEVTEKLAAGDLYPRVTVVRNDEIGRISKSFNRMADTIHILINNLEETVKVRTAELEATNEALNENKDQLRLILDSAAEAIYGIDKEGNCTFCNASCIRMLGCKHEDELLGKNMHRQIHHSSKDGTAFPINECRIINAFIEGKGVHVDDEVFWRLDGTSFEVEYYSYPQYKDDEIVGAVVTFMDITKRKKDEEQIKYLSCHDSLTGLYNRSCFEESLKEIDNKKNFPISIIFGDINGLKLTNDIFGHTAGDELIKKSAEILKKVCREEDIVARVGGDEFIILLPNTENSEAEKIITRIKNELSTEKIAAIKCSMSLGCYTKTSVSQDIERTMESAEDEMYKDKTMSRKKINSDLLNTIIATLHDKSPRERQHSLNVSELCRKMGMAMQLPETEVIKMGKAGFLHDIGKIVLDKDILHKEGPLTEKEHLEVQQHSVIGYRILNLFDDTLDLAEGVYSHHEKWDGSGYPKGIKGEEIPLMARIIAVAETYDRITATNHEKKLEIIKNESGIKFDPKIVDMLCRHEDGSSVCNLVVGAPPML